MNDFMAKMVPVTPSEKFPFHCKRCGACCRHVKASVPLESMDAFRLAKYLRDTGDDITCVDDVLARYADPVLLHESGYTVFMLKTAGPDDACIFLKDNQCTIHAANPRACRTYPVSVGPVGNGRYEQYLSMEQPHHFKGTQISVKKWLQSHFSQQDRDFLDVDIGSARELAKLLEKIPQSRITQAVALFLYYKYSDFNLDQSFVEQFKSNNEKLLRALRKMAAESDV